MATRPHPPTIRQKEGGSEPQHTYPSEGRVIRRGAEAELVFTMFRTRPALVKKRLPRPYRLEAVDDRLRRARTKCEARLLRDARAAGARTPVVYDVDAATSTIVMQYIVGPRLKDALLDRSLQEGAPLCHEAGRAVGMLHAARITHGDLTTSNFIAADEGIYVIDMGLGSRDSDLEAMAVDMRTFERAFESTHPEEPGLWDAVLEGYISFPGRDKAHAPAEVIRTMGSVKSRGRYR